MLRHRPQDGVDVHLLRLLERLPLEQHVVVAVFAVDRAVIRFAFRRIVRVRLHAQCGDRGG